MLIKKLVVLTLVLGLSIATVVPRVTPVKSHIPRTYKVSLDDTPLVRWKPIVTDYI